MVLKDKVIVITGGCKGFGKGLAKSFIKESSIVVISSNDKESLFNSANELSVDSFYSDVTNYEDVKKLGEYVVNKYGRIDIWINNAGIQIAPSLEEEVSISRLHDLFEVNFFGYFYGSQIALTYMKKQGNGLIMNINSTAGLEGKANISAYSSSKFAVKGLTETIRKEIEGTGIQIFGIFPGGMKTDIYKEKVPSDINEYMEVESVVEKVINNLKLDTPEKDLVIKRPKK